MIIIAQRWRIPRLKQEKSRKNKILSSLGNWARPRWLEAYFNTYPIKLAQSM